MPVNIAARIAQGRCIEARAEHDAAFDAYGKALHIPVIDKPQGEIRFVVSGR